MQFNVKQWNQSFHFQEKAEISAVIKTISVLNAVQNLMDGQKQQ